MPITFLFQTTDLLVSITCFMLEDRQREFQHRLCTGRIQNACGNRITVSRVWVPCRIQNDWENRINRAQNRVGVPCRIQNDWENRINRAQNRVGVPCRIQNDWENRINRAQNRVGVPWRIQNDWENRSTIYRTVHRKIATERSSIEPGCTRSVSVLTRVSWTSYFQTTKVN